MAIEQTKPVEVVMDGTRFELQIGLEPDMVAVVRRFVESLYGRVLDPESASKLALTAHELMDNAVRYACGDRVLVRVGFGDGLLEIHTQNRAAPNDIASIRVLIEEMNSWSDPFQYYLELMDRTSSRLDSSGLGLGRIWAEADMTLTMDVEADIVSVCAAMPMTRSAA